MNLEQQFIFGQEAEKVINNKAYQYALTAIRGEAFSKLENTPVLDSNRDERDSLIRKLQAINSLQDTLEDVMQNGEFAKAELERTPQKR